MTSLNPSPFVVSMVQVASMLPYFLFALAAGALADAANRRKILLIGELASTIFAAGFAVLVVLHLVSTLNLLLVVFLIEAATAVTSPAWQSIVPQLALKRNKSEHMFKVIAVPVGEARSLERGA
jgi:MFS family permease